MIAVFLLTPCLLCCYWQEEPSYEAVPQTVYCISKTPKRFQMKGIEKREINNH